jgi:hypothetical protein
MTKEAMSFIAHILQSLSKQFYIASDYTEWKIYHAEARLVSECEQTGRTTGAVVTYHTEKRYFHSTRTDKTERPVYA